MDLSEWYVKQFPELAGLMPVLVEVLSSRGVDFEEAWGQERAFVRFEKGVFFMNELVSLAGQNPSPQRVLAFVEEVESRSIGATIEAGFDDFRGAATFLDQALEPLGTPWLFGVHLISRDHSLFLPRMAERFAGDDGTPAQRMEAAVAHELSLTVSQRIPDRFPRLKTAIPYLKRRLAEGGYVLDDAELNLDSIYFGDHGLTLKFLSQDMGRHPDDKRIRSVIDHALNQKDWFQDPAKVAAAAAAAAVPPIVRLDEATLTDLAEPLDDAAILELARRLNEQLAKPLPSPQPLVEGLNRDELPRLVLDVVNAALNGEPIGDVYEWCMRRTGDEDLSGVAADAVDQTEMFAFDEQDNAVLAPHNLVAQSDRYVPGSQDDGPPEARLRAWYCGDIPLGFWTSDAPIDVDAEVPGFLANCLRSYLHPIPDGDIELEQRTEQGWVGLSR